MPPPPLLPHERATRLSPASIASAPLPAGTPACEHATPIGPPPPPSLGRAPSQPPLLLISPSGAPEREACRHCRLGRALGAGAGISLVSLFAPLFLLRGASRGHATPPDAFDPSPSAPSSLSLPHRQPWPPPRRRQTSLSHLRFCLQVAELQRDPVELTKPAGGLLIIFSVQAPLLSPSAPPHSLPTYLR
jgi:hypothetical protein